MTYVSAPYWWLTCDAPGCNGKSTEGSDYAAWAEQSGAWEDASDGFWTRDENDQHHYCIDHGAYVCGECGRSEGHEYPREHDGMCDECWAEDVERNQESPAVTP